LLTYQPEISVRNKRYTANQIEHLLSGCSFFDGYGRPRGGESNDKTWRAAWDDLRDELLPGFIEEYPGHRPWAWWRYDSPPPHRRRRIGAKPHPFDNRDRKAHIDRMVRQRPTASDVREQLYELWFGKPASVIGMDDIQAEYESEREFLERHRLLTDPERTALGIQTCTGEEMTRFSMIMALVRLPMFVAGTYFYGFCSRQSGGNDVALMALGAGLLVASMVPWGLAMSIMKTARA